MDSLGIFAHHQHQAEIEQIVKRGDYKQFELVPVSIAAVGFAAGGGERGLFEKEGNCLILVARFMNNDKTVFVSDITGRVYIKFNHPDNPWLPFSLIAGSLDFSAMTGTIGRFWIYVPVAVGGASLYFIISKGAVLGSAGTTQGPTGGGYGSPSNSTSGPPGSGGGAPSGGGGGTPPPGGGGGFGGGGFGGNQP